MCTDVYFPYSQKERLKYQKDYMESIKKLEEQMVLMQRKNENSHMTSNGEVVNFIIPYFVLSYFKFVRQIPNQSQRSKKESELGERSSPNIYSQTEMKLK